MGLAMSTHYCGGHAVESQLTLGYEDLNCGMKMVTSCSENDSNTYSFQKKPCCENKYKSYDIDDDFLKSQFLLDFSPLVYVQPVLHVSSFETQVVKHANHQKKAFYPHAPPLQDEEIYLFIQSFLL